jgi:thymidylate kinase
MGIRNYLIEGVSGAGKTTVAEVLQRRGHHVIHGDRELSYRGDPATGKPVSEPAFKSEAEKIAWQHRHWIWNVEQVKALIADQQHASTFFCGGSRNSHAFVDLFDAVFVLVVDLDTLNKRLAVRPEDEFGGRPSEAAFVRHLHATREDIPERGIAIDATVPAEPVVDQILAHCEQVDGAGEGVK